MAGKSGLCRDTTFLRSFAAGVGLAARDFEPQFLMDLDDLLDEAVRDL